MVKMVSGRSAHSVKVLVTLVLSMAWCSVIAGDLSVRKEVDVDTSWYCGFVGEGDKRYSYFSKDTAGSSFCGKFSYGVFGEYNTDKIPYVDAVSLGAETGYYDGASWGNAGMFGAEANGLQQNGDAGENADNFYYGLRLSASFFGNQLRPYMRGGFHSAGMSLEETGLGKGNFDFVDKLQDNTFYGLGVEYRGPGNFSLSSGWDRLYWGDDYSSRLGSDNLYSDYYGLNIMYNYRQ